MKVLAPRDASTDVVRSDDVRYRETYTIPGTLAVGSGAARLTIGQDGVLINVLASVNTAPTGASAIFDLHKNGTTVFTGGTNRPTIAVSTNADTSSVPAVTTFSAGDYFTVDVDQIGSTIPGADAVITIEWTRL